MKNLHAAHPLRIFWVSAVLTLALGFYVTFQLGPGWLWLFAVLVLLEVTFSFDNAVINSKVLARMSKRWQTIFLTVGIFIAVFLVRFLFPILIVMIASNTSFQHVLDLAFNKPEEYSDLLHHSAPLIDAFGGSFLIMIGISYFMDRHKDIHWLGKIENKLAAAGKYENLKAFVMLGTALVLYSTVDPQYRMTVLVACIAGIILHMGLEVFGAYFAAKQSQAKVLTGMAAFTSFLYLEVLDASFSLDGVIGAFAITDNIILIVAGLGAGALWVRSLTIYLLRAGTLGKYRFLEHGAHWAILLLGIIMFVKLYHIEPPEWFTGSIGLVLISAAVISSILVEKRRSDKLQAKR